LNSDLVANGISKYSSLKGYFKVAANFITFGLFTYF
jgi:hypothetical protein